MWHTIVSPTGREKTGYPTQKPEGLLRRFVQAVLAARATCAWTRSPARARSARSRRKLGRRYLLIDESPEAVRVMRERLGPETVVAFGPGRVNLIGEHTDYNDGLAMPFAIERGVTVTATPREALRRSTRSTSASATSSTEPERAHGWRAFRRGMVAELRPRVRLRPAHLEITGDLPQGSGLSSSAALEAALALALLGGDARRTCTALAKLCSRVENDWVGAETGLLDQFASLLSQPGHVLRIDFRALDVEPHPLDLGDWQLVTLDSGATHTHRRLRLQRAPRRVPRGLRGARHRLAARRRRPRARSTARCSSARATSSARTRASTRPRRRSTRTTSRRRPRCSTPRTPRCATTTRRPCPRSRRPSSA